MCGRLVEKEVEVDIGRGGSGVADRVVTVKVEPKVLLLLNNGTTRKGICETVMAASRGVAEEVDILKYYRCVS